MMRALLIVVSFSAAFAMPGCDRNEIDAPTSEDGSYAVDGNNAADSADNNGGNVDDAPDDDRPRSAGPTTTIRFAGLRAEAPQSWVSETPSSQMRAVQMTVPGAERADNASFVIFTGIGGGVAENVARWEGQFSSDSGEPVKAEVVEQTVGDLAVATAILSGTYTGGMQGEFAGPGVTMMQTLVKKPSGETIFIRLLGPSATVNAQRDAFFAMLGSME